MNILFRADASDQIGSGHVMRCLSLANALRIRGAKCRFVCREFDGNMIQKVKHEEFEVSVLSVNDRFGSEKNNAECSNVHYTWLCSNWRTDAEQTILAIGSVQFDWVVVDHYALDARWELALKACCKRLMVIDDLADRDHDCDLLLDQNLVADMAHRYDVCIPVLCTRLLGPEYALLQPQYAEMHPFTSPRIGPIKRIFVFFGWADNFNLTGMTIAAFLALNRPDIALDVVINSASRHASVIYEQARAHLCVTIYQELSSLAPLMMTADLAIGAGGATSWERCCLGLPSLVVTLAENQKLIAAELHRQGLVRWVGHQDMVSETVLKDSLQDVLQQGLPRQCSERCLDLVDGRGVERVASIVLLNPQSRFTARLVQVYDEALILRWANDPFVRKNAFNSDFISDEMHHVWFNQKIENFDRCKFYIVETIERFPIGQVRFEQVSEDWEIHYALNPCVRNRGVGINLLKTALLDFKKHYHSVSLYGLVKINNIKSQNIFKKLGFKEIKGETHFTYLYREN